MANKTKDQTIEDLKKELDYCKETISHQEEEINLYKEMVENYQVVIDRKEKLMKVKDFMILKQNMTIQMHKIDN